jgi:thermolysin
MAQPTLFGDPDHYAIRFTGPEDNGGVHINSGIMNNAFFLAVEGGVNRYSGQSVTGVGGANRANIEQAFYRGIVLMLPASASFSDARAATVLAATELFGTGSPEAVAIDQAWSAVGVE